VTVLCALFFSGAISPAEQAAGAEPTGEPSLPARAPAPAAPPAVLSIADAARYAAIFGLQQEENWKAADGEIANLQDRALLGTVLAERYLSPHYATTFDEAASWLTQYGDLPDARAVWQVARRKATGNKIVPQPTGATVQPASVVVDQPLRLPPEPSQLNLRRPPLFEAGLVAWRGQKWADAAKDFETVATSSGTSSWYVAAAAFWAARAHLALHQPDSVDSWFEMAARQPRTFYGLLARDTLGLEADEGLGPHALTPAEVAELEATPGGMRALALVQVGETDRAEAELKALSVTGNSRLADAIVALADLANMPTLCMSLGYKTDNEAARYPVPRWEPQNGYVVDRALMFALMMEESRFNAGVHSYSGAAGLMQLMPATARSVARTAGIPLHNVSDLVDPALNLSIGQEYVRQLIGHQQINGNLILMLAAYNSGPGVLAKWQNKVAQEDPLLFIEGLSGQETRLYVERVMTNLWIYRQRLGQTQPDLDALAANQWPTYVSVDATSPRAAQHAQAR
jgi:soluble lytic murein transglycosylase-like protein